MAVVGPMTGDEAAAYIADSYTVGPDIIAEAKKITSGHTGVGREGWERNPFGRNPIALFGVTIARASRKSPSE